MKEELLRLADACEAATGPEFAIDCEIEALVFDNHQGMMRSFTRSLDAAMTLVGEALSLWSLLTEAAKRCALAAEGEFEGEFRRRLPAFVCAAALRASVKEQNNGG